MLPMQFFRSRRFAAAIGAIALVIAERELEPLRNHEEENDQPEYHKRHRQSERLDRKTCMGALVDSSVAPTSLANRRERRLHPEVLPGSTGNPTPSPVLR